jgi:hypothetical protein
MYVSLSVSLSFRLSVSLFICLSVCLPVYLSIYLSLCMYVCQSICLFFCLPVCLSVCLSGCLSICLPVFMSLCLCVGKSVCLSFYMYVCLSFFLPACLSVRLVHLPVRLSVCLSVPSLHLARRQDWSRRGATGSPSMSVYLSTCLSLAICTFSPSGQTTGLEQERGCRESKSVCLSVYLPVSPYLYLLSIWPDDRIGAREGLQVDILQGVQVCLSTCLPVCL